MDGMYNVEDVAVIDKYSLSSGVGVFSRVNIQKKKKVWGISGERFPGNERERRILQYPFIDSFLRSIPIISHKLILQDEAFPFT